VSDKVRAIYDSVDEILQVMVYCRHKGLILFLCMELILQLMRDQIYLNHFKIHLGKNHMLIFSQYINSSIEHHYSTQGYFFILKEQHRAIKSYVNV